MDVERLIFTLILEKERSLKQQAPASGSLQEGSEGNSSQSDYR